MFSSTIRFSVTVSQDQSFDSGMLQSSETWEPCSFLGGFPQRICTYAREHHCS